MRKLEASALNGLIIFLFVLIFGSFWRFLSLRFKDTPAGQAMAFAY